MKSSDFDMQQIVDYLIDTPYNLSFVLDNLYPGTLEEDLTKEDYQLLNQQLFRCKECDCWEVISGSVYCDDCQKYFYGQKD